MHASLLSTFFLSFFLCTTFSSVTMLPSVPTSPPALSFPLPLRDDPPSEFLPSTEPCLDRLPDKSLYFLFDFRLRVASRLIYPLPFCPGPMVVDRFFRGELDWGPFGISALSFALLFLTALATSGSSMMGTTSAISSGLRLSSLGALSEPAEEVDSPSVCTSECYLSTFKRAFLI